MHMYKVGASGGMKNLRVSSMAVLLLMIERVAQKTAKSPKIFPFETELNYV